MEVSWGKYRISSCLVHNVSLATATINICTNLNLHGRTFVFLEANDNTISRLNSIFIRDYNQKHRKIYDTRFGDGYSPKTVRHKHQNDLVFRIDVFLDVEKDAKISVAISQFFSFQLLGQNYNMLSGLVGLPFYYIANVLSNRASLV